METQLTMSSQQWNTLNNMFLKKTPGSTGNSTVRPIQSMLLNVAYRPGGNGTTCNGSFCIFNNPNNSNPSLLDYGISGVGIIIAVISLAVLILLFIGIMTFCRPPRISEIQEEDAANSLIHNEVNFAEDTKI